MKQVCVSGSMRIKLDVVNVYWTHQYKWILGDRFFVVVIMIIVFSALSYPVPSYLA